MRVRWTASGPTIYAYVGNDPLGYVDPLGLNTHDAEDTLDDELNPKIVSILTPPFDSGAFVDDHLDKHDVLDPTSMVVSALGLSRQSADACKSNATFC